MSQTDFPVLYKYTQKGQVQQWQIIANHDRYWTIEGIQNGTLTTSKPTVCLGKNIGRANQTSPFEQAVKEAQAKWQKKVDSGYNEILTDEKKFREVMLACDLAKYEKLLFTVPTFISPKLDGLRDVNEDNTQTSRNGKPYLACPHLNQDKYVLDGELYNHDLRDDFNKIVSLCKKQKPTEEELKESAEKVQFWAYDLPTYKGTYSDRYIKLANIIDELREGGNKSFYLVPAIQIFNNEEMEMYHERNLEMGFEGSMIRLDLGDYEDGKRSKQLLKKKDFIDEEFKIIGAEEGIGGRAGTIGFFIIQHDKNPDKTFKSNVKGDFEYLEQVWKDREKYIGTMATIKYFNRTPDDVPRFPYIIKLNRAEYE
jgi:DNA ligase-1